MSPLSRIAQNIFLIFILGSSAVSAQEMPKFPDENDRVKLFNQVVSEMNRLDGEGLIPRANRPQSWIVTTTQLSHEAKEAKSFFELGRVFKRLNATYPNLHARLYLHKLLDSTIYEGALKFNFTIAPDLKKSHESSYDFFIKTKDSGIDLKDGDQVIAIGDQSIKAIEETNFIFCKFPLKSQCALDLFANLKKELLFWSRSEPLLITVKRNNKELKIKATYEILPPDTKPPSEPDLSCEEQEVMYLPFKLDFKGYNLCAYTSKKYPKTLVLRIKSFVYGSHDPIGSLRSEVDLFWFNYWSKKSAQFDSIVFDMIDNHGGNSPIPYYALFTQKPYQEQFAQFRKIKELERKDMLENNFWGDQAKDIWLQNLKKNGIFDKTPEGEFLPAVPQFCADQKIDCRDGLFQPRRHSFKGKIKILMNQWTISSGVGFVDNMVKLFKNRVTTYGHYDSADSAYSRATVAASLQNNILKVEVLPLDKAKRPDQPEPWIRQIVSVTRSTDSEGHIISGVVQKMDHWIPKPWQLSDDEWQHEVFKAALKN